MRRAIIALGVLALCAWAPAAFAQSSSSSSEGDSSSSAGGGSASSGNSSSSVEIHTSGGASVGVAQGNVSSGSRASGTQGDGDQTGSATGGDSVSGQGAGVAAAPPANATQDGVVNQVDLPALDLGESETASGQRPDFYTWAIVGIIVIGLVVLYRRLPRATAAS